MKGLERLLDEIMRYKSTIGMALEGQLLIDMRYIKARVEEISVKINASDKRKLIDWLQGPSPEGTGPWALHYTAKKNYEPGTGDWIFKTPEWDGWISGQERALWLNGIPGAGKTVLASHIIEKVIEHCEANDSQQLLSSMDVVPRAAWEAYKYHIEMSTETLLKILGSAMEHLDKVYIGVDALDESQNREHLLALLDIIVTDPRFSRIQLFATSRILAERTIWRSTRQYEDIRIRMCSFSQSLRMSNTFVDADIQIFISAQIKRNSRFQRWPGALRDEVEVTLSKGAKGMFRWFVCQLDIMRRLHQQSKIQQIIKNLPETLDKTYERILSYISLEERDLVKHAIHWICFHDSLWDDELPLITRVLLDSYRPDDGKGVELHSGDLMYDLETLKELCGCLITVIDDREVRIAHYTVREFLESQRPTIPSAIWLKMNGTDYYTTFLDSVFTHVISPIPLSADQSGSESEVSADEDRNGEDDVHEIEMDANKSEDVEDIEDSEEPNDGTGGSA
ncbi:hypothetical protein GQ53DRAFT_871372 [Thozetella sp. PMI_491]|nr:hypothetical protein GQ53DRAFT_871372 [Thozetella sp. PMI_491]